MITQYKVITEFTHQVNGILIPIHTDEVFNWNFLSSKFELERKICLGTWTKETEKEIGKIISIDKDFIKKNSYYFKAEKPIIFTSEEVKELIKDLKNDYENNGEGYYLSISQPLEVFIKFQKKSTGNKDWFLRNS